MKTRIFSLILVLSLLLGAQTTKAQEEGDKTTLEGYFIKRADDTYIHIQMVGVRMIFKLLDENYQEIENVFTRGVLNITVRDRQLFYRMVIQPTGDGFSLQSSGTILRPHLLTVNGSLFMGEDDTVGESFNLFYNQHTLEKVEVTVPPEE